MLKQMPKKFYCTTGDGTRMRVANKRGLEPVITIKRRGKTLTVFLSPEDAKAVSKILKKQKCYDE